MPRVSVSLPTYNCERYVGQSIESLLGQTFGDLELVISDNASTDGTEQICRDYARRDSRVRYVRRPDNIGAPANFRYVFSLCRGEYHKWSTSDDFWAPDFLQKSVAVLDAHPDVVLCYPMTRFVDADGKTLNDYEDNLHLLDDSPRVRFLRLIQTIRLCHADLGLIRRATMERTMLMTDERASDVQFLAELSLYGKFWLLPERLYFRRMHPQSSSWDRKDENRQRVHYDPGGTDRLGMHNWRKYRHLARAVRRSPVSLRHKAALLTDVARWMVADRRGLASDLMERLRAPAASAAVLMAAAVAPKMVTAMLHVL